MSSRLYLPDDPRAAQSEPWLPDEIKPPVEEATSVEEAPPPPPVSPPQPDPGIEQRIRDARDQGFRDGREQGLREGEAAGRSRAAAELQPVIERLARGIDEIAGLRARFRRESEGDLVRLALAIARRVLHHEVAIDPDALHRLVLGALEKLQSQEICRVRVHPAQATLVKNWLQQINPGCRAEIMADSSREPGGVIFETARGCLDASVESQLREIQRGLADRLSYSK